MVAEGASEFAGMRYSHHLVLMESAYGRGIRPLETAAKICTQAEYASLTEKPRKPMSERLSGVLHPGALGFEPRARGFGDHCSTS